MKLPLKISTLLLMAAGGMQLSGCQSLIPTLAIPVTLAGSLSSFDLVAGEQKIERGTVNFTADNGFIIGRGNFALDIQALSFLSTEPMTNKLSAAQAITNTIVVTAFIAPVTAVDMTVEVGDAYGPFTITLGESFDLIDISPSSITLTPETIDLLNAGSFSIALQVESSVSGAFVISSFLLNLGL